MKKQHASGLLSRGVISARGSRRRVDIIRTASRSRTDRPSVADGSGDGLDASFHADHSVAETRPTVRQFSASRSPSRNFREGRKVACGAQRKARIPIRDDRGRSLDENPRWNERFAARTHTAARSQVSTRRYGPRLCTTQGRSDSPRGPVPSL